MFFFLMIRRPPRSTRTDTLFPYTTLFRSISGHATFDMAVSATKMGAYDFLTKPFKTDVLLHTVARAIDQARLRRENRELIELAGAPIEELIGSSPAVNQLRQSLNRVAPKIGRAHV